MLGFHTLETWHDRLNLDHGKKYIYTKMNIELEKKLALARIYFEEFEIKLGALETKNAEYTDEFENFMQNELTIKKEIKDITKVNDIIKKTMTSYQISWK